MFHNLLNIVKDALPPLSSRETRSFLMAESSDIRLVSDVPNTVDGVELCATRCKDTGAKYFGLECPRATIVHCQCSSSGSLGSQQTCNKCDRDARTADQKASGHCAGPFKAGRYMTGGYHLSTVYSTTPLTSRWYGSYTDKQTEVCPIGEPPNETTLQQQNYAGFVEKVTDIDVEPKLPLPLRIY